MYPRRGGGDPRVPNPRAPVPQGQDLVIDGVEGQSRGGGKGDPRDQGQGGEPGVGWFPQGTWGFHRLSLHPNPGGAGETPVNRAHHVGGGEARAPEACGGGEMVCVRDLMSALDLM